MAGQITALFPPQGIAAVRHGLGELLLQHADALQQIQAPPARAAPLGCGPRLGAGAGGGRRQALQQAGGVARQEINQRLRTGRAGAACSG